MAFQPVVEVATRRTIGFEALARFNGEPARGPDVWFTEAAAAAGLEVELELLAVRSAVSSWRLAAGPGSLFVNASPKTAVSGEMAKVAGELPVGRLTVEITEHAPVGDYAALSMELEPLRSTGARIAVDDAGAGFASLRHILLLAPDIVKLDASLTRGVHLNRSRRALARALISRLRGGHDRARRGSRGGGRARGPVGARGRGSSGLPAGTSRRPSFDWWRQ